jgi:hypothetical protein
MDRSDEAPDRVRLNVWAKSSWVVGLVRTLRVVIEGCLRFPSGARNVAGTARNQRTEERILGISNL